MNRKGERLFAPTQMICCLLNLKRYYFPNSLIPFAGKIEGKDGFLGLTS
jgi:hypothetical protein